MFDYTPKPIDTGSITLSNDLLELTEELAQNTHDQWALRRFSDGWTYGIKRDDDTKKHPCLVSYSDLPENEKEYDRLTAMETLKTIMVLGFSIKREHNE